MKKIKSIRQLKAEKRKLRQRQEELEKAIRYDWRDLKDSLRPKSAGEEFFSKMFNGKEKEEESKSGFFSESISYLAAKFAKKMAEKAEEKMGSWFKKHNSN